MKKLLSITLALLFAFTSYAHDGKNGTYYCGKHESHKKISLQNGEMVQYVDNLDLENILTYSCTKFDSSFPGYEQIMEAFERSLTNLNSATYNQSDLWGAKIAARALKDKPLTYCGNPNGGGLYVLNPKASSLYLYDIETDKLEWDSCIPI